jgi:hypothetical protein
MLPLLLLLLLWLCLLLLLLLLLSMVMPATTGLPAVRVPVLSNTTVSTCKHNATAA